MFDEPTSDSLESLNVQSSPLNSHEDEIARRVDVQNTFCSSCVRFVERIFTNLNKRERKFPGLFPTRFLSVSVHTCLLCPQLPKHFRMARLSHL